MKKSAVKFFDKIIVILLGVFGFFNSCDMPCEYGSPHADYELKGVVTDIETSNPIPNIRVIRKIYQEYGDTVYTDVEGKYAFYEGDYLENNTFRLKIEDIDGEENGGDFRTQEIAVKITEADKVEEGKGWYSGKFVKIQNIKLISKDTEMVMPLYGVIPNSFEP